MKDNGDVSLASLCFEHVTIADLLNALRQCRHQYHCCSKSVSGLKSAITNLFLSDSRRKSGAAVVALVKHLLVSCVTEIGGAVFKVFLIHEVS
jgi:hypothetical protein